MNSAIQNNRKGAMLVMIAFAMIIIIVGAVLSIDIAYMHMVRAELRTATDAAARAGAETLARTQDPNLAIDAAIAIAAQNDTSGKGLELRRSDVIIGGVQQNADGKFEFVEGALPFSSVRVAGNRTDGSLGGAVPLLFAPLLGTTSFQPNKVATATSSVRDIALILDRSGSMNQADAGNGQTRNEALIVAVNEFIAEVQASSPNSRISLTTYSTDSSRDIAMTENFGQLQNAVNNLPAAGFTNIFEALRDGSDSLQQDPLSRPFAEKTIVLMTDGNFNVGGNPLPSARRAEGRGQTIHTVTFSGGANQGIMRRVANIGNGLHFHADDAEDLREVFRDIARTLAVLLVE